VSEFDAKTPQATASEGLAQGPYLVARAGFEPAALRTKSVKSTNEKPSHTFAWDSNLQPFGRKASNLPMRNQATHLHDITVSGKLRAFCL